jgi:uncharacterized protein YkwD
MAEKVIGRELALPAVNPFTDTSSEYVQKAYLYGKSNFPTGVVNGTTDTTFSPNERISRQQIAVMTIRAFKQMEVDTRRTLLDAPLPDLAFKDKSKITDYAVESIKYAVANGMIKGDDKNNFNPHDDIASDQCVALILRSFNRTQTVLNSSLSNAALLDKAVENLNIGFAYGDIPSGVSRNVVLPTTALGGATVSWYSSNQSIIDTYGNVSPSNRDVTLTATVRLANATKTKTFELTTTTLTGDSLLLANARAALELGFRNPDDNIDRVTDNVFLPTTVLGLPVSWRTSNASVVTDKGLVNVPSNATELTATLTASFSSGSQSGTRAFTIRVRNANYISSEVYLHNIKLGMTSTEVTNALTSSPNKTFTLASGESWSVYYSLASASSSYTTGSVQNFIAVAFKSNKVIGIYTMVNNWSDYLRDGLTTSSKKLTAAEVNRNSDLALDTYTDSRGNIGTYAAFLYDLNSTAGASRTLTVASLETFLLELFNAYRGINGYLPLTANTNIATSARSHSADLIKYDRFDDAGSTTNNTYAKRAAAAGFSGSVSGMISNNEINPFDYLDDLIETAAYRTTILSTGVNVVGIGASTGAKSATNYYTDIVTAVFGVGTTFTFDYANYIVGLNQDTTVIARSNSSSLTNLSYKSGTTANATVVAATGVVTGKKVGTAAVPSTSIITATAKDGSATVTATATVTVEPVFTVTSAKDLLQLDTATNKTAQLVIGNPYSASGASYTYTSSNTSVATVSASGVVTAVSGGNAVITVRMTRSGYGGYIQAAPVNVTVKQADYATDLNISLSPASIEVGQIKQITAVSIPAIVAHPTITWTVGKPEDTGTATIDQTGKITGVTPGTVTVSATMAASSNAMLIPKEIVITVNPTVITEIVVAATANKVNLTNTDPTVQLVYTITPNYAPQTQDVTWSNGNHTTISVSNTGLVTATGNGDAVITVTLNSNPLITATINIHASGFPTISPPIGQNP